MQKNPWYLDGMTHRDRNTGRLSRHLIFFLFFWMMAVHPLWAQETRYTFVLRGVPLDQALQQLITTTSLDLGYDPTLVADKYVYCVADRQPVEEVLQCILNGTGLDYFRLSSGLYVLTEAPEAAPLFGNLQGIVLDLETGEPLAYAHVLLSDGRNGTTSNDAGRFIFSGLKPGSYRLTTSYLGYRPQIDSVEVFSSVTTHTQIALQTEPILVAPIVVDGLQWRLPSDSLGYITLDRRRLLQTPQAGTPDLSRSLSTLAGVRLNDATANLHLQGGESGEHQFRLDGAPVFAPLIPGILIGPFSPFAIDKITVQKSGFGAEGGSQMAGVIEAEHALGHPVTPTLDVQTDPLSVNARLNAGLGSREKTSFSFMASGRYGLWNIYQPITINRLLNDWNAVDPFMLAAFSSEYYDANNEQSPTGIYRAEFTTGNPGIGFYDLHLAARLRFSALRSLHFSTYLGQRQLNSDRASTSAFLARPSFLSEAPRTRDTYNWESTTSQLRYESVLGSRTFASLRARRSAYHLRHDNLIVSNASYNDLIDDPTQDNGNQITEYGLEGRLDYAVKEGWLVEGNVEPTFTKSRFFVQGTQELPVSHRSSQWRMAGFVSSTITLSHRLTFEAGTRITYLPEGDRTYPEPRLAFRYDQTQPGTLPWSFRIATGIYRQFVQQYDISSRSARGLLSTNRAWMAVDESVTPPLATHFSAELLMRPATSWTLRMEGYYKNLAHLLAIDYTAKYPDFIVGSLPKTTDASDMPSLPQASFLVDGKGQSYGLSLVVEKEWSQGRLAARYDYSQSRRSFSTFYDGKEIPTPWNEPHHVELSLNWKPLQTVTLLGRWQGIWGRTWGYRQAYYDFLGAYREVSTDLPQIAELNLIEHIRWYQLSQPQNHKLPPLYQLDLSLALHQKLGKILVQSRLDLMNVFDRNNVADWRLVLDPEYYQQTQRLRRDNRLLLPFTPSLALRIAWQ